MSSQRRGRELVHAGSKNPALPGGRIREARLLSLSSAGGAERRGRVGEGGMVGGGLGAGGGGV